MRTTNMNMRVTIVAMALMSGGLSRGDEGVAPEADRAAIKAMSGEFRVRFRFEETALFRAGGTLAAPYREDAHELVLVVRDEPGRIELQHLLVHEGGAIKHWRQVWKYEDRKVCEYRGGDTWVMRELTAEEVKGTWTQQVTQTDDSPRYEGVGRWTHGGGVSQWTSGDTWRPLPRRELKRSAEYQVIAGTNRHAITATGWVHEQDNTKSVLSGGEVTGAVAREAGVNSYERIDGDERVDFGEARRLWEKEGAFWNVVLGEWERLQSERRTLKVGGEGGMKELHKAVEGLSRRPDAGPEMVAETIGRFLAED
jgi:hypothetical protein